MGYKAIENILSNTERIKLNAMLEELYGYLSDEGFIGLSRQIEQLKETLNATNSDYFKFKEEYTQFKFDVDVFMQSTNSSFEILSAKLDNLRTTINEYIDEVETIKDDAKTEITNTKDEAISDVTTLKTQIEDLSEVSKNELNEVKNNAILEINTAETETKEAIENWRKEVEASDVVTETTINNASLDVDFKSIKVAGQPIQNGSGDKLDVLRLIPNEALPYNGGWNITDANVTKQLKKADGTYEEYSETLKDFLTGSKKVGFAFSIPAPNTAWTTDDDGTRIIVTMQGITYNADMQIVYTAKSPGTGDLIAYNISKFEAEQVVQSIIPTWLTSFNINFKFKTRESFDGNFNTWNYIYIYATK